MDKKQYLKEYYQKNKETWPDSWAALTSNPERHAAYNERRRQNKSGGKSYRGTRSKILAHLGGKCQVCGTTENLEINHRDLADTSVRRESSKKIRCSVNLTEVREGKVDVELLCKEHHKQWSCAQRKAAMKLFASIPAEEQRQLTREMLPPTD